MSEAAALRLVNRTSLRLADLLAQGTILLVRWRGRVEWWRRRELNPRPRTRRRSPLRACLHSNVAGRLRTEPSAPPASPDSSRHRASGRLTATSLLNDGYSQATGLLRVTAHWLLSSESVVCVRSYVCVPQDLRGRGPRHAFRDPVPPSKPNRPR